MNVNRFFLWRFRFNGSTFEVFHLRLIYIMKRSNIINPNTYAPTHLYTHITHTRTKTAPTCRHILHKHTTQKRIHTHIFIFAPFCAQLLWVKLYNIFHMDYNMRTIYKYLYIKRSFGRKYMTKWKQFSFDAFCPWELNWIQFVCVDMTAHAHERETPGF